MTGLSSISLAIPAVLFLASYYCFQTNGCWCTATLLLLTGLGHLYNTYYRSKKIAKIKGRGVLITGCDTGFGHQLAIKLHGMDFTVFACCLDDQSDGAQRLRSLAGTDKRMHVLKMDVTNENQIEQAREYVQKHLPELGLWGVVNNAGLGSVGWIEWIPMATFEKVASVNLFGTVRVTKAFAPMIRKSRGRIVNVSSFLGRSIVPMNCVYTITKFGVSAFTDVLRQEMKSFGVSVCAIEPGNFLAITGIVNGKGGASTMSQDLWDKLEDPMKEHYGPKRLKQVQRFGKIVEKTGFRDTSLVIDAMTDALCRLSPKDRYFVASVRDKMLSYWYFILPTFIYDAMLSALLFK